MHEPGRARPEHDAVHRLAKQTQRPLEEVQAVYERELEALSKDATVTTYLPVIAYRQARERLMKH
jgi:hypothetical protein